MWKKNKSRKSGILVDLFILAICLGIFIYIYFTYTKPYLNGRQGGDNSALGLYYQGKSLESAGKYDEALRVLKESIRLDPNIGKAHLMLGVAYTMKGRPEEAKEEYEKALQLDMDEVNMAIAHHNLGVTYLESMGLYNKAIAEFEASIKMYSGAIDSSADAYEGLSRAYLAKVDYEKAIKEAKKSIELNPRNGRAYFTLGTAYLLKKDIKLAEEAYEKLKDIDKNIASKLYVNIEQVIARNSEIKELTASGCFNDNNNAACFYKKAYSLAILPPSDFYKNFTNKVTGIIDNGWLDNDEGLKEILIKNKAAIAEFKKAVRLEKCDFAFGNYIKKNVKKDAPFSIDMHMVSIDVYTTGTLLAKLVLAEARLYEKERKVGLALDNYLAVLKFAEHLEQQKDSTLIDRLMGMKLQSLTYAPLSGYIKRMDTNTRVYKKLLNSLISLRSKETGLESVLKAEKEYFKSTVRIMGDVAKKEGKYKESAYQELYREYDKLIDEYFGYLFTALKENRPEIYEEKFNKFQNELKQESGPLNWIWLALKSRIGPSGGIGSPAIGAKILFSLAMPRYGNYITSYYVTLSRLDILITASAVKLYQLKAGKPPDELKELIPGYLPKIPEDPFDNLNLLKYKSKDKEWVVYSFGPDKEDNQAFLQYRDGSPDKKGDIFLSVK